MAYVSTTIEVSIAYSFHISRKSEARDGRTGCNTCGPTEKAMQMLIDLNSCKSRFKHLHRQHRFACINVRLNVYSVTLIVHDVTVVIVS